MYAYPSAKFANALTTSFNMACKIEVWQPTGTTPIFSSVLPTVPSNALDLYILDGSVTYDKTQDCRSQCSLKLVTPAGTYIPRSPFDIFTPWGNEIHVFWGLTYEDGTQEFVLMGKFRIGQVAIDESQGAPIISLTGYDRSRNISRNVILSYWPTQLIQQLELVGGLSFSALIQLMCSDRWPAVQFNDDAGSAVPPYTGWNSIQNDPWNEPNLSGGGVVMGTSGNTAGFQSFSQGTDLWAQSRQYAQACGCDLFFSRDGICTFRRDPNFVAFSTLTSSPVVSYVEGATAMFDKVSRVLDDSAAYNGVLVYGEGTSLATGALISQYPPGTVGTPGVFLPAVDDDPTSATYWYGPYGQVPQIITNNLLVSQAQCDDYALYMLINSLGAQEAVKVPSSAVNPCIDVDDVIQIQRTRIGIPDLQGLYIATTITTPLTSKGQQSLTVRQKKSLSYLAQPV